MKDEIHNTIEAEKEVLSALPLKTKKNKTLYLTKVQELKKKYKNFLSDIAIEIVKRSKKIKNIEENSEISIINTRLKELEENMILINKNLSSFEKMGLDKITYGLIYYYKENLNKINKNILKAINIFNNCGIELTAAHFDYSHYTYDYMLVFFKVIYDLKSDLLRQSFEKIFWKCPDLIVHLDLNIRYLYLENKNEIDKYFSDKKKEFLLKEKMSEEEVFTEYYGLIKTRNALVDCDQSTIIKSFIDHKYSINDYSSINVKNNFAKLIIDNEYYTQNEEVTDENIVKLEHSLIEYQDYLSFRYVIDDIIKKYKEKDTYKNILNIKLKEISKQEDILRKMNLKIYKLKSSKKDNKKIIESLLNETDPILLDLKNRYAELDVAIINDKVYNLLNNDSTYHDILSVACSNYNYLTRCIKDHEKDITEDDIKTKVYKLKSFINNPYNTIINNININDNRNIILTIVDRYKLLNINITEENLEERNLENYIASVHIAVMYLNIVTSHINIEDVDFVLKALPII